MFLVILQSGDKASWRKKWGPGKNQRMFSRTVKCLSWFREPWGLRLYGVSLPQSEEGATGGWRTWLVPKPIKRLKERIAYTGNVQIWLPDSSLKSLESSLQCVCSEDWLSAPLIYQGGLVGLVVWPRKTHLCRVRCCRHTVQDISRIIKSYNNNNNNNSVGNCSNKCK